MSVNKRKIIAYDDIEETADAKRLRYEGYNYGAQQKAVTEREGNGDEEAGLPYEEELEKHDDAKESEQPPENAEETKTDASARRHEKAKQKNNGDGPRPDFTTGMRAFIPGLDDDGAHSDQDEETTDALAYLRSVRSEASGIPGLLTAPRVDPETDEEEDMDDRETYTSSRGYYADGAYVSAPPLGPMLPNTSTTSLDPQDAYYARLLAMFQKMRATLHLSPDLASMSSLDVSTTAPLPSSNAPSKQWNYALRERDPHPVQIAQMSTETVLRLLQVCYDKLRRNRYFDCRLSAWLWALLARLPDVGTLGSEEVAVVRDLGKRAVWVSLGWQDAAIAAATAEQYSDAEGGSLNMSSEEVPAGSGPDENTRAMLGMIITVAGEVYGQRDLLEFREKWDVLANPAI